MQFQTLKTTSKSKEKSKGFGTDARFESTRDDKRVIKEKRPDPNAYRTSLEWRPAKATAEKAKPWN
jgi:hypothetical protein